MRGVNAEREPVVHVIDDDASIRDSIENLLLSIGRTSRTYGSATDFLESVEPGQPGCIFADIRLPGLGGLELQRRLGDHGITMPVVLMTGYADIPMTVRGLKDGAIDFLQKPLREQDIIDATNVALERDRARRQSNVETRAMRIRFATLTQREKQVVSLVAEGNKNREIAGALSIREITVKLHRGSAMRKLEARNVQELVRTIHTARKLGLESLLPTVN